MCTVDNIGQAVCVSTMPESAEVSVEELRPLEREESDDAPLSRVKGAGLVGVASPTDGCLEKLTA